MLFLENIKLAITSIRSNKMRSFLTMLGIIIGISSVIAITSIGDSAKATVSKEFESFGKNNVVIYPDWRENQDMVIGPEATFSREDMDALSARFEKELVYIDPYVSIQSETTVGRVKGKWSIQGVAGSFDKFKKMNIIHGRMITDSDLKGKRDYIVIEKKGAEFFFNTENPVGKTLNLSVNGDVREFVIIGVYAEEKSLFSGLMSTSAYSAYSPYSSIQGDGELAAGMLNLYIGNGYDIKKTSDSMVNYLEKVKGLEKGTYISDSVESQQGTVDKVLGTLSLAIGAIAGISLVVGGIGIMNIMLVSVTERTREIGIRKALGARTKDILVQFLIESMIISAIGGVIGTALGSGIAIIGMAIAGAELVINPLVVVFAVVFSALVGIFFGIYPARKAAKLDPIEALRYE